MTRRQPPQTGAKGRLKGTDIDCGGWEDFHTQTEMEAGSRSSLSDAM